MLGGLTSVRHSTENLVNSILKSHLSKFPHQIEPISKVAFLITAITTVFLFMLFKHSGFFIKH